MLQTHRQYLLRETMVNIVIGTVLSIIFAYMVVHDKAALPLWGMGGIAFDFVPQTFMLTLATTLAITLITRKRVRLGSVPPMPVAEAGLLARLPHQALLRAVLVAVAITLILSPLASGVLHLLEITELSPQPFMVMKAVYGAALSLFIAPPIARAALAKGMGSVTALGGAHS